MPALVCPNCCSTSEVKLRPYIFVLGLTTLVVSIVDVSQNVLLPYAAVIFSIHILVGARCAIDLVSMR
jgi:hypothetical protein